MTPKVPLASWKIKNQVVKEFLSEMIGTLILVLVCNCSIAVQVLSRRHDVDVLAIGFATGAALMVCAYCGAKISGGHVNPVVTLAVATLGHFPYWKIPHYFAAQYLGGFLATVISYGNHYSAITMFDGGKRSAFFNATSTAGLFTSHPTPYLSVENAVIDQIVCVALLQLGIMCIIDANNLNTPKPIVPVSLFVLLAGLIAAFGLNCGPALNPARDIPGRLFAWMVGYGPEVWAPHSYSYWFLGGLIAPHIGAILGGWIYHLGFGLHVEADKSKCTPDEVLLQQIKSNQG